MGYNDTSVRQKLLRALKFKRIELLDKNLKEISGKRIKDMLSNIHLLVTANKEHRDVYPTVPLVGFNRGKSLQDILNQGLNNLQLSKKVYSVLFDPKIHTNTT